jgi:hypothetical protein
MSRNPPDRDPAILQLLPVREPVAGRSVGTRTDARRWVLWQPICPLVGDDQPFELSEQAARIPVCRDQDAVGRQLREGFDPVMLRRISTPLALARSARAASCSRLHGSVGGSEDPCEEASVQGLRERLSPLASKPSSRSASYSERSSSRSSSSAARCRLPTGRKRVAGRTRPAAVGLLRCPPVGAGFVCPQPLTRALVRHRSARRAKPPLRPLAPSATPAPRETRTRSPASASVLAAEQPVMPPADGCPRPADQRSACCGAHVPGSSSQYEVDTTRC